MTGLILASASPRRQSLLQDAGYSFRQAAPGVQEWSQQDRPELSPEELARANARHKAQAVARFHPDSRVLAADTVVTCHNRILGKPAHLAEAAAMLAFLSGKTHEVLTAVVLIHHTAGAFHEHVARTHVTFRPLDDASIAAYLGAVPVLDKAGAYAYQDRGADIIERIEGSATNVIGLPMEIVRQWLDA